MTTKCYTGRDVLSEYVVNDICENEPHPSFSLFPENMTHWDDIEYIIERSTQLGINCITISPYVISQYEADDIIVCYEGKRRKLSDSKLYQEQKGVFTAGEILVGEGEARIMQAMMPESEANNAI